MSNRAFLGLERKSRDKIISSTNITTMSIFKTLFSKRKGLTPQVMPTQRDRISVEVINAINSAYYILCDLLINNKRNCDAYGHVFFWQKDIERMVWWQFMNQPLEDFEDRGSYRVVFRAYMEDANVMWYQKLDLLEYVIRTSVNHTEKNKYTKALEIFQHFIHLLNQEFERLDFGYRIVNLMVTDITSEEEKVCIEKAIAESTDNVRQHMEKAIELYRTKPTPDVRNSIKEAITAVEAACRELTGENTLGDAIKKLESKGVILQDRLKASITQMYAYTNQPNTGIRHALMDPDGKYMPTKDEAYFMLISCSAFINYLRLKATKL